jgi:hypothetical protein
MWLLAPVTPFWFGLVCWSPVQDLTPEQWPIISNSAQAPMSGLLLPLSSFPVPGLQFIPFVTFACGSSLSTPFLSLRWGPLFKALAPWSVPDFLLLGAVIPSRTHQLLVCTFLLSIVAKCFLYRIICAHQLFSTSRHYPFKIFSSI